MYIKQRNRGGRVEKRVDDKRDRRGFYRSLHTKQMRSDPRSYPEVVEHNSRAEDVLVQRDQVRLEGFDEE